MRTFTQAVLDDNNGVARTTNGMRAEQDTNNACVDLFFNVGAYRGKNIVPLFEKAYREDPETATRIALWARDVRGGAGERKLFRDILAWLVINDPEVAERVLFRVPELGRWDDLLSVPQPALEMAFNIIANGLNDEHTRGLVAKWMPRKGIVAVQLRSFLRLSPRSYRKMLVGLTNVVEQNMCAKDWDGIDFNKVPSLASARYKKAFARHTTKYAEYVAGLKTGATKVNAGAVYPYDVLKGMIGSNSWGGRTTYSDTELAHIEAQWAALPNYVGDASILPLVDVSGSMTGPAGNGQLSMSCLDVAVSLGLYLADKNKGAFKDTFLTFNSAPDLLHLKGTIVQKIHTMDSSTWGGSTDLHKAFEKILNVAIRHKVSEEEMPKILLILSDMQFNSCTRYDDSAIEMIRRKYEKAGYALPQVVFWCLNAKDNAPVKFNAKGVALVSGFSPAIMKSVLKASLDPSEFTPYSIMKKTVYVNRYFV